MELLKIEPQEKALLLRKVAWTLFELDDDTTPFLKECLL